MAIADRVRAPDLKNGWLRTTVLIVNLPRLRNRDSCVRAPYRTTGPDCVPLETNCQASRCSVRNLRERMKFASSTDCHCSRAAANSWRRCQGPSTARRRVCCASAPCGRDALLDAAPLDQALGQAGVFVGGEVPAKKARHPLTIFSEG